MDIFNEEDLLAIANDGGSSSSCADNNSIDESIAASDELSGGDAVSDDVYKQREVTEPPAVRDVAAKEEDSDDDESTACQPQPVLGLPLPPRDAPVPRRRRILGMSTRTRWPAGIRRQWRRLGTAGQPPERFGRCLPQRSRRFCGS